MKKSKELFDTIVYSEVGRDDNLTFTYKQGKGHFSIKPASIIDFKVGEFRRFLEVVAMSSDSNMIAGYINSMLRKIYEAVILEAKNIIPTTLEQDEFKQELTGYLDKLIKFNDILSKSYNVKNIATPIETVTLSAKNPVKKEAPQEVQETEVIDTANEIMTDLKRCNVNRLIPTQIKPVWENAKLEVKIGYQFNYRGMDLQLFTDKGWVNKDYQCKIFIVDPVIGLPITSYDGTLSELENKLSEVFINYLKTIESNKEAIVQIANSFKNLKAKVA